MRGLQHVQLCSTKKLSLSKKGIVTIIQNVQTPSIAIMSDQGHHYRWLLTTCDSWRPRSPSWGAGLLNDNSHQWNALIRKTTHCLLNQESLLRPVRQVIWIRIPEIHPVQWKLGNHSLMTRRKRGTRSPSHPEKAQAEAMIRGKMDCNLRNVRGLTWNNHSDFAPLLLNN